MLARSPIPYWTSKSLCFSIFKSTFLEGASKYQGQSPTKQLKISLIILKKGKAARALCWNANLKTHHFERYRFKIVQVMAQDLVDHCVGINSDCTWTTIGPIDRLWCCLFKMNILTLFLKIRLKQLLELTAAFMDLRTRYWQALTKLAISTTVIPVRTRPSLSSKTYSRTLGAYVLLVINASFAL